MSDLILTSDHDAPAMPSADAAPTDQNRRAALAKLGQLAGCAAPAMLTLLVPRRTAAQLGSPPNPPT